MLVRPETLRAGHVLPKIPRQIPIICRHKPKTKGEVGEMGEKGAKEKKRNPENKSPIFYFYFYHIVFFYNRFFLLFIIIFFIISIFITDLLLKFYYIFYYIDFISYNKKYNKISIINRIKIDIIKNIIIKSTKNRL